MGWLYHDFIHPSVDGHLGWFKFVKMANGIPFKIQGLIFSSFKCMPRSEIAGPHDKFMFNAPRK